MRAAAILGLGSSTRDLKPFQGDSQVEWVVGLPAEREDLDAILVFGGDGTVHRHLGALVKLGLPVLVVPAGSGNDFARALRLFRMCDSLAAWKKFAAGGQNLRTIDLGMITPLAVPAETAAKAAILDDAETARLKASPDTNQPGSSPLGADGPAAAAGLAEAREEQLSEKPGFDKPGFEKPGLVSGHHFSDAVSPAQATASLGAGAGNQPSHPQGRRDPVYFSCVAGVGLDGEVSRVANALPRWLRAHGGYALSLPPALLSFRPFSLTLSVAQPDGAGEFFPRSQQPVLAAIFANTPVYGGGMRVAPRARMDDGLLDMCVIRDASKLKLLSVFPLVYFGRHLGVREVEYFSAACTRVETDRPLDIYADGEYVCSAPVELSVAKAALSVIVP